MKKLWDAHFHLPLSTQFKKGSDLSSLTDQGLAGGISCSLWWDTVMNDHKEFKENWITRSDPPKNLFTQFALFLSGAPHPVEIHKRWENYSLKNIKEELLSMRSFFQYNREYIWAIGETGLDLRSQALGKNPEQTKKQQEYTLEFCMDLAEELNIPLILHLVHCEQQFINLLKKRGTIKVPLLFHSYGFGENFSSFIDKKIPIKFYSFSLHLLDPKRKKVKDAFKKIAPENILLETDSPDQNLTHQENTPANVTLLYNNPSIIEKFNTQAKLIDQINSNISNFLGINNPQYL